jgi:hypothetical protein
MTEDDRGACRNATLTFELAQTGYALGNVSYPVGVTAGADVVLR